MPTSDDGLDFSGLSDDQIVELAVALAREAMFRNPALQAAFSQALLDERERVEAASRGNAKAKMAEVERVERQAAAAAEAISRESERKRVHGALAAYLRAGAEIVGQKPADITLIWDCDSLQARGEPPRLRINLGRQTWSLVDYDVAGDYVYTSPGLHGKRAALEPWCRETSAALSALGIGKTTKLRGIDA
ncbi:MAG: hypothetical protein ACYC0F_05190 [Rhodanobacter sp.]